MFQLLLVMELPLAAFGPNCVCAAFCAPVRSAHAAHATPTRSPLVECIVMFVVGRVSGHA